MATFILIHGSWHGAWCWERLIPALHRRGHRAIALDLPGMGADGTPLANVTLQSWASFVVNHVREAGEPVILVGHSRGGVVISAAAEMAPEHIQGLVYLTAVLLPNGATVLQLMELLPAESLAAIQLAGDGAHSVLQPDKAAALLYNTTAPEWVQFALGKLGPDPTQPNTVPLCLTPGRYGSVPRFFIECLQDRTLSIDLQRRMVQAMPCKRVLTLDTDHSPFLSAPERLAESLITTLQAGERPVTGT
jgi:pimeloyl-ACP methyl ester carboxylesterase